MLLQSSQEMLRLLVHEAAEQEGEVTPQLWTCSPHTCRHSWMGESGSGASDRSGPEPSAAMDHVGGWEGRRQPLRASVFPSIKQEN